MKFPSDDDPYQDSDYDSGDEKKNFDTDFDDYQLQITYSTPIKDDLGEFEYRMAILPYSKARLLIHNYEEKKPVQLIDVALRGRLMSENEWREIGIQMSPGWVNYASFPQNPSAILFRRPLTKM